MKLLTSLLAALVLATPLVSLADTGNGLMPSAEQLLARIAALEAIVYHKHVTCAMAADPVTVATGKPFVLAWGTYGAVEPGTTNTSELSPEGEETLIAGAPGNWKYTLTFHGTSGDEVTCVTYLTVTK